MQPLYALTLLVSAALLFSVQPMFAKMVLPLLGGTPAVWNTCMVFYQAALLGGYLYAHASIARLGARRQAAVHLAMMLLPWLVLPIGIAAGWTPPADRNPIPWMLLMMAATVGLPFAVVSATAPMLQAWFARTGHPAAKDPYFLYGASNLGSMVSLLGYPTLVEPLLPLASQAHLWTIGYGLLTALTAACAVALWRSPVAAVDTVDAAAPRAAAESVGWRRRLRWLALSFAPSSLLLGVTTHIATDIASVPLLWVIPLALYLLTFVIVFARRPLLPHAWVLRAQPFFVLPLGAWLFLNNAELTWIVVPAHLATFFVLAMACHGELAATRPPAARLTEFYLWMSVGGVLGGAFNAIVAPLVFPTVVEYPLMMVVAVALRPTASPANGSRRVWLTDAAAPAVLFGLMAGIVALAGRWWWGFAGGRSTPGLTVLEGGCLLAFGATACLSFVNRPLRFALGVAAVMAAGHMLARDTGQTLLGDRSFFGVLRVRHNRYYDARVLAHGSTSHGIQGFDERRREPLSYYHRGGPLGQTIAAREGEWKRLGVIGLGTGTIAAYGKPGMEITFYEIDPAVERIARDSGLFTYLADSPAKVDVVLGDARLTLARAPDGHFDLLVLDAFSSDSIPIHLLTREALQLYLRKLAADGVLALHISNRYLELAPVVGRLADDAGLRCLQQYQSDVTEEEEERGKLRAHWVVAARGKAPLKKLLADKRWQEIEVAAGTPLWTDDFSNIFTVVNWSMPQTLRNLWPW